MPRSLSDGDRDTAEMLNFILGDEIVHVYYGNHWVKEECQGNKDRLKDILKFGAEVTAARARENAQSDFAWQVHGRPVDYAEGIDDSLRVEGLTGAERQEIKEFVLQRQ